MSRAFSGCDGCGHICCESNHSQRSTYEKGVDGCERCEGVESQYQRESSRPRPKKPSKESTKPNFPGSSPSPKESTVSVNSVAVEPVETKDFSVSFSTSEKVKNQINFTTNSLAKKSSTVPRNSTTDSDGRKIWSWPLSYPVSSDYDGINANANFESDGNYKWYLNFYTLPQEVAAENTGFVNLSISLSSHKDHVNKKVEVSKEYQVTHSGSEANYHSVDLGELSISEGVGLIMLYQSLLTNGKTGYTKDLYVIGLSAVQQ